jgi:23S rRNA (adenine2503-C2)-methyltransferase
MMPHGEYAGAEALAALISLSPDPGATVGRDGNRSAGAHPVTVFRVRQDRAGSHKVFPQDRYRGVMDLQLLQEQLEQRGEPAFRAGQVFEWAARGAPGYDAMTNVPAALRAELAEAVPFSTLEVVHEAVARDGTVKVLFRTADGHPVESVLMRYRDGRRSICVSSQSGCPLTCTFCATGRMRFGRNLTPSEIVDQALHFRRIEAIDHCVFMGMGEPLLNLEGVLEAARKLPQIGITHRRTTISTVGWLPALKRFVDEVEEPIRLALSLHAPDDSLRSAIMPVNERFPLADVVAECRRYFELRGRKVFVEYVMLAGVNDSVAQARQLVALLDPKVFKVNLIPYNPTGMYDGSSRKAIDAFKAVLDRGGLPATVRLTRGRDIAAACGQLAAAPKHAAA